MKAIVDANNPGLKAGGRINDYRIERIEALKEISSVLYELEHSEVQNNIRYGTRFFPC